MEDVKEEKEEVETTRAIVETTNQVSLDSENPFKHAKFEYDATDKSLKEQAKDFVDLAATSKAVEDVALVNKITDYKKEELETGAATSLKEEQVKSSEAEKALQKANYGTYEGIAELIGLKKPLPNKMLCALMYILIPFLVVYYFVVGLITGLVNITMDCINAVVTRFAEFTKPAKKIILFILIVAASAGAIALLLWGLNAIWKWW